MRLKSTLTLVFLNLLATTAVAAPNVVRNGSFEGSTHYWLDTQKTKLVEDAADARSGSYVLQFEKGGRIRTTAIPARTGKTYRVGMWAKAAGGAAEVRIGFHPAQREIAHRSGGWGDVAKLPVTAHWTWVETDVQAKGDIWPAWWRGESYTLRIGADDGVRIDGVAVWSSEAAQADPRCTVEATVAPVSPRPYDPDGGLYSPGETVQLHASAFNASDQSRQITLRMELMNYEGTQRFGDVRFERRVEIAAGASVVERVPVTLDARGLMLVRLSVLDASGELIDRSDAPLTVLPFPKQAAAPDFNERFGASMRGNLVVGLGQKIGFRFARWTHRGDGWGAIEPEQGKRVYRNEALRALGEKGFTEHVVLWGPPEWATGGKGHHRLPKDMDWKSDDPRWDDLSIRTGIDEHLRDLVMRYRDLPVVFELSNEPDLVFRNDPKLSGKLHVRLARVVRETNPKAFIVYNCTWPTVSQHGLAFFEAGGAKLIDAYSYHNYSPSVAATAREVQSIRGTLSTYAPDRDIEIWFNEGWCYINSSRDDAQSIAVGNLSASQAAHAAVRYAADVLSAGQDKIILFHIGYGQHGRSFWDAVGSGTELWEEDGTPTVMVAGWNTAIEMLGLSDFVRTVRPRDAVLHVFDDKRNGRGVIVAFATRGKDVEISLPLANVIRRDVVGVDEVLASNNGTTRITLRGDGQPVYLLDSSKLSAERIAEAIAPLDEGEALAEQGVTLHRPPTPWFGVSDGSSDNNPARGDGVMPVWRFDQVHPSNVTVSKNFSPMTWNGRTWIGEKNTHGGQPSGASSPDGVQLASRGAAPGKPGKKISAVSFLVVAAADHVVEGRLRARRWEGSGKAILHVLIRRADKEPVRSVQQIELKPDRQPHDMPAIRLFARPPEEIILALECDDGSAWNVAIEDLRILEQSPQKP